MSCPPEQSIFVSQTDGSSGVPFPAVRPLSPTIEDLYQRLRTDGDLMTALQNSPDAGFTAAGLSLDLVRYQQAGQCGKKSVRSSVFYLPASSPNATQYAQRLFGFGGAVEIHKTVCLRNPLAVQARSGGAADAALAELKGWDFLDQLEQRCLGDLSRHLQRVRRSDGSVDWAEHQRVVLALREPVADILHDFGGDPQDAEGILMHSGYPNGVLVAILENVTAHAARSAGYDAVLSYDLEDVPGEDEETECAELRVTEIMLLGERIYP